MQQYVQEKNKDSAVSAAAGTGKVLELPYLNDLSFKEIVSLMNRSFSMICNRHNRGMFLLS